MRRCFRSMAAIAAVILALCGVASAQSYGEKVLFEEMLKLASKGQPEAEYHVGMFYNNGIGTAADPTEALQWFRKSAEGGDPLGAYKLGCYYAGQFAGVIDVNLDMALKYKLVAAEQGYDLAQFDVGRRRFDEKNYAEAIRWWTKGASQGEPNSLYHLSALYAQGKVVEPDLVRSFHYLIALKNLPEIGADPAIANAYASLTSMMSAADLAAANEAKPLAIEPTPLTLRARQGLSQAKLYLADNM